MNLFKSADSQVYAQKMIQKIAGNDCSDRGRDQIQLVSGYEYLVHSGSLLLGMPVPSRKMPLRRSGSRRPNDVPSKGSISPSKKKGGMLDGNEI